MNICLITLNNLTDYTDQTEFIKNGTESQGTLAQIKTRTSKAYTDLASISDLPENLVTYYNYGSDSGTKGTLIARESGKNDSDPFNFKQLALSTAEINGSVSVPVITQLG